MSNEELALAYQGGDNHRAAELWEQNIGLLRLLAVKYFKAREGICRSAGVTFEDLLQEGYFIIMNAARAYDPQKGFVFTSYIGFHARGCWDDMTGLRTPAQRRTLLNHAISIETPIGEEDDLTVGDMIADPAAEEAFEDVERRAYVSALRADIEQAIAFLPGDQQYIMRRAYLDGAPLWSIAAETGMLLQTVYASTRRAMNALRRRREILKYREQADAYRGCGVRLFQTTWTSSTERAALCNIEHEERQKYRA